MVCPALYIKHVIIVANENKIVYSFRSKKWENLRAVFNIQCEYKEDIRWDFLEMAGEVGSEQMGGFYKVTVQHGPMYYNYISLIIYYNNPVSFSSLKELTRAQTVH